MNDFAASPARRHTARLSPDASGVARAADVLRAGGLVAFPTETVYGLGGDATDPRAVAAIYAAKGRPSFNPLIAHVASLEAAQREGVFDADALLLAKHFWPGPLTLVVARAAGGSVCDLACAGLASIALRIPAHPLARDLLEHAGQPIAAPSANRSGHVSPTRAEHVLADLDGAIDAVLDGGATDVGVESTIVACLGNDAVLLRPGGIPREAIEDVLGKPISIAAHVAHDAPQAPGMLASHYAPHAQVRLAADRIEPGEAALLFGPPLPGSEAACAVINLSENGDLVEAAARLYDSLRKLDETGAKSIAVAPIPDHGLGAAVNDRLRRAAAPRTIS